MRDGRWWQAVVGAVDKMLEQQDRGFHAQLQAVYRLVSTLAQQWEEYEREEEKLDEQSADDLVRPSPPNIVWTARYDTARAI